MSEKLTFDTGIREFEVNGDGVLRFNPSDPNVYQRFQELSADIQQMEKELSEKSGEVSGGMEAVALLVSYDKQVKAKLSYVFGEENDFDALLHGVNLMAVTKSGSMVIVNLLNALRPIIEQGVRAYARAQAAVEVEKARRERAER